MAEMTLLPQFPPWVAPVAACVRAEADWLLRQFDVLALAAAPGGELAKVTSVPRLKLLRGRVAAIPLPLRQAQVEGYARRVLALLASDEAQAFESAELQALVAALVDLARARCGAMAAALTELAVDQGEVKL